MFSNGGEITFTSGNFVSKNIVLAETTNRLKMDWVGNDVGVEVSINGGPYQSMANGIEKSFQSFTSYKYRVTFTKEISKLDKLDIESRFVELVSSENSVCGNGVIEGIEECDDGIENGDLYCNIDCTIISPINADYSDDIFDYSVGNEFCEGVDLDGDGYKTGGSAGCLEDCNDYDYNVNPGRFEINDGIDNNCDG